MGRGFKVLSGVPFVIGKLLFSMGESIQLEEAQPAWGFIIQTSRMGFYQTTTSRYTKKTWITHRTLGPQGTACI